MLNNEEDERIQIERNLLLRKEQLKAQNLKHMKELKKRLKKKKNTETLQQAAKKLSTELD